MWRPHSVSSQDPPRVSNGFSLYKKTIQILDALARTNQRPEICVGDDDFISNFVALSTISDWQRLAQLNVVEIRPHFVNNINIIK